MLLFLKKSFTEADDVLKMMLENPPNTSSREVKICNVLTERLERIDTGYEREQYW